MPTYAEKLKDPRWYFKRTEILERDDYTCRDCGKKEIPLQVHHCAYYGKDPWDAPNDVLLSLCETCHWNRQESDDAAHLILGRILATMNGPEARRYMKRMNELQYELSPK